MTYFHINPLYLRDPDEQDALNAALTALAGLPTGYLDTLITAHDDCTNAIEAWCDEWRDEHENSDDLDWPEPEDQPEYEVAVDTARQAAIDEHHVTGEQLMHIAVIAGWGTDGVAELRARNAMYWAIREAQGVTIDG